MKIVVIGNGMVGYKFCEKLVEKDSEKKTSLRVFGEEKYPAYDRVHLSEYFEDRKAENLYLKPTNWYADNGIDLHIGEKIVGIHLQKKQVENNKGEFFDYDKLVFATGSNGFVPPIPGVDKKGVFVYRGIDDLKNTLAYLPNAKTAAVLGGGLLGLEAANGLLNLGLKTHVVEFAPKLMPRQLDDKGSKLLKKMIEALDISIHLSKSTTQILGEPNMTGMQFDDGTKLEVDILLISAGISPADSLAREIDLEVGVRGGVVVNNHLQTSHQDIYAIGEVALHKGMIYGLVAPGYEMADILANNLIKEDKKEFKGYDMSTKLKLIGIEVGSFGDPFATGDQSESIVYENEVEKIYKRINVSADGEKLLGGILVGDTSGYGMMHQMFLNGINLPKNPEILVLPKSAASIDGGALAVDDLPDAALICSCENVNKGEIYQCVADGNYDVDAIKSITKAGTGCGGCMPMVKDLLVDAKKKLGVEVKNVICEHFDYSRQELFHIVKTKGIKAYYELLGTYGKGDGCETCKPIVASIMASLWNEKILDQHETIQDTNDRFLANIQKGGTYSVIPRVPGGEITPDQLLAIGSVAKKYDLYTKITGGQRIDLLGAEINDLPAIWEELIAAGLESGHAYGKSLRTVKSCVGESWCRYGLQDSTLLAIELENRYKGLRSPHKFKSAVSGCIRECAEAQSKDFGVIATEKGWNLYVCGNGGAKPQHATLLAQDIDKETLVKYVDRFLMFYIRTAEPLQRTSVWFTKLEGGIDYLKEVIIEDSLGLCNELEIHMQHHVDTYHCEWKDVVEDPEKRKRFAHFANSSERDETLKYEMVRGQKQPVKW